MLRHFIRHEYDALLAHHLDLACVDEEAASEGRERGEERVRAQRVLRVEVGQQRMHLLGAALQRRLEQAVAEVRHHRQDEATAAGEVRVPHTVQHELLEVLTGDEKRTHVIAGAQEHVASVVGLRTLQRTHAEHVASLQTGDNPRVDEGLASGKVG